jgi:mannose-1-phosphate guanylyltransferase
MPILECAGKHGRAAGLCHHWGVILAGGDGKRLLPLTRRITGDERPKQFCCVIGRETLLHQTRIRVAGIVPPYQILVVLTKGHEPFYADQVDDLLAECLLIQPDNRGTAPAILYSLTRVRMDSTRCASWRFVHSAASKITVEGARYPEHLQRLVGR